LGYRERERHRAQGHARKHRTRSESYRALGICYRGQAGFDETKTVAGISYQPMAFVCTADDWRTSIRIVEETVIIGRGYDDVEPESYSLLIFLDVMAGGDLELFFCIIKADQDGAEAARYWSGLEVARFASQQQRAAILEALLRGLESLLKRVVPKRVFCCTHDENPPPAALQKHLRIAEVFEMCGYEVEAKPICLGKHSWWMERQG
jgi:hypothetical protein